MPILAEFRPTGKSIKSESGARHVATTCVGVPVTPRFVRAGTVLRLMSKEDFYENKKLTF
jgi:hypothetical protein